MFLNLTVITLSCACAIATERVCGQDDLWCGPPWLLASGEFRAICFITSDWSRSGYWSLPATVRAVGTTDERTVWRRNISKFVITDRQSLTYTVQAERLLPQPVSSKKNYSVPSEI